MSYFGVYKSLSHIMKTLVVCPLNVSIVPFSRTKMLHGSIELIMIIKDGMC